MKPILDDRLRIIPGQWLWSVTCKGRREVIVGVDMLETYNRAVKHFLFWQ